jgi:hypothetical protein
VCLPQFFLVFCVVGVESKGSRRLVVPRTSCYFDILVCKINYREVYDVGLSSKYCTVNSYDVLGEIEMPRVYVPWNRINLRYIVYSV